MKRYHVTTRLGDRTIAFEEPLDDPFVRHTVVLGWRDLLAGLLHRELPVTVIIGADRVATRAVMSLDLDQRADQEAGTDAPVAEATPACDGFWWIGQPFYCCDNCGRPAWEHVGRMGFAASDGPFEIGSGPPEPWKPGEAERIRERWEPAWHEAAGCTSFRGAVKHGPKCPTRAAAASSPEDGSQ